MRITKQELRARIANTKKWQRRRLNGHRAFRQYVTPELKTRVPAEPEPQFSEGGWRDRALYAGFDAAATEAAR